MEAVKSSYLTLMLLETKEMRLAEGLAWGKHKINAILWLFTFFVHT